MASIPLTFAALASSAVPDFYPTGARKHTCNGTNSFTSVVVSSDTGDVIVRVPVNDAAAAQLQAENTALAAFTPGVRTLLPFAVPEVLGITRSGDWPAVVSTFLPGGKFRLTDLSSDSILLASIAGAFEALHQLPVTIARQAGLPVRTAENCRIEVVRLINQAWDTKRLPVMVKERWEDVLRETAIWDFQPLCVHGSINDDSFLIDNENVVGMLGFDAFSVGDPAVDFAWLCAADDTVLTEVLTRYAERTSQNLDALMYRAHFYHELELAKWLLHGVSLHDKEIITDAENLLDALVDRARKPFFDKNSVPLNVTQVSSLLNATEQLHTESYRSHNGNFSALDDDRVFTADTDFIDPLPNKQA